MSTPKQILYKGAKYVLSERQPGHTKYFGKSDIWDNLILDSNVLKDPEVGTLRDLATGETPLHLYAKSWGMHKHIKEFLAHPAVAEARDNKGDTPLHVAVRETSLHSGEILSLLLKHPSINKIQNKEGKTPLHLALEKGSSRDKDNPAWEHPDAVLWRNKDGDSFLHEKIVDLPSREKLKGGKNTSMLLNHPLVSEIRNKAGRTPLHELAISGSRPALKHPNARKVKDSEGYTPRDLFYLGNAGAKAIKVIEKKHPAEIKSFLDKHGTRLLGKILGAIARWLDYELGKDKMQPSGPTVIFSKHRSVLAELMDLNHIPSKLYRGLRLPASLDIAKHQVGTEFILPPQRFATSWTTDVRVARQFANGSVNSGVDDLLRNLGFHDTDIKKTGPKRGLIIERLRGKAQVVLPPINAFKPWFHDLFWEHAKASFSSESQEMLEGLDIIKEYVLNEGSVRVKVVERIER